VTVPGPPDADPGARAATVVVSRRAVPGREAELEEWLQGVVEAAAAFPGHLGARVYRPVPPFQTDHVLVFRFATESDLARWNASPERARWLRRAEPLTAGAPRVQVLSGLEGWFALPGGQAVRQPPRWKTAVVTAPVIYLLVVVVSAVGGPLQAQLPLLVRTALTTLVLVPTMTWVVMPAVTRVLRPWLYPHAGERRS